MIRASELIASHGLAAFGLRGLADDLGVAPNAIYNHVTSRDDLLDAVAERFVTGIRLPDDTQPWTAWLPNVAASLRRQLLERPGITEVVLRRAGATPTGPDLLARFLDRLEAAGLQRATAHLAWHLLLTIVVGSVQQANDQGATFEAVLDVAIAGLATIAQQPPSPQAIALLDAHRLTSH